MSTPDRSDATRSARATLHEWVDAIPAREPTEGAAVRDPRTWVAALALEGTWLGLYQDAYRFTETEWDELVDDLSRYADVRPPARAVVFRDVELDEDPFRDDERPLVDAVLRVALRGGGRERHVRRRRTAVRPQRVDPAVDVRGRGDARRRRRDRGGAVRLRRPLAAAARPVARRGRGLGRGARRLAQGRGAPAPLRARRGRARRRAEGQHIVHADVLRAWREEGAPSSLVLAALACDGWRAGERQRALLFPSALPGAVVRELARLVDDATGPGTP